MGRKRSGKRGSRVPRRREPSASPTEPASAAEAACEGGGELAAPQAKVDRRLAAVAAALALVVAVAAMAPGLGGELLNWDDDRFVRDNPAIRGFELRNLRAIFGRPQFEAYHPLHLLSYLLDYQLFRLWAPGYKLHNFLLYLVCLALLYLLARRLGIDRFAAWAAVLLFAAHPLHVEAVVWVTARKEALSLAFMLGAALTYLRSARWTDRWGLASAALFLAALLTKTSTVVLPALLLAIELLLQRRPLKRTLLRVAPMIVIALGVGIYVVTLWQENEMARPMPENGAVGLVALVGETLWHYLTVMVWPRGLSPVYPIDRVGALGPAAIAGYVAWTALLVAALRSGDRWIALGWIWAAVALLPVSNVLPVYFFVQDRYAFIATAGAALAVGRLLGLARERGWRAHALVVLLALIVPMTVASALQARHWRTSLDLWRRATAAQPGAYYGHLALGHTLREAGDLDGAIDSYERAIEVNGRLPYARLSLCLADGRRNAQRRSRPERELDRIGGALRQHWGSPSQLQRLASQIALLGYLGCAQLAESRAFELEPPDEEALVRAASRWTLAGDGDRAMEYLDRARPEGEPDATFLEVEAQALELRGDHDAARRRLRRSFERTPREPETLLEAARRLLAHGRPELALLYADAATVGDDAESRSAWSEVRAAARRALEEAGDIP